MHLFGRLVRLAAVAMGLAVVLLNAPLTQAGATAPPTLQAQPNSNVPDGSVITASGSGFTPGATIAIVECESSATNEAGCDISNYEDLTASSSGDFSTPFIASRYLHLSNPQPITVDCAAPGACILVAANYSNTAEAASTPLAFNPSAPTPPPLAVGGSLAPAGTVGHKTGAATISGTVTCNRPVIANINGQLSQTYRRFIFTSFFSVSVLCTSSSTWTAVVQPQNGLFGQGTASVSAYASGYVDGGGSQAELSGTVTLKYAKPTG